MKNSVLFFLLLCGLSLYSQETPYQLPTVIPPSPTVANVMQFEEVPVDNYTGQPDITIPIFSKNIHQEVPLHLALRYNSQGIKVDNRSGWTGTGWSLFAGGTISRTVRGFADESALPKQYGVYHNDDFWNFETLSLQQQDEFTWNALGTSMNSYDTEMDLYQFSFLNFSGRFVITREGPQLLSNNPNIDITVNQNTSSGEITSFTITDTKGYKYHFDVTETTYNAPFYGQNRQGFGSGIVPELIGAEFSYRSAWHLSKITTSNAKELVSFTYQDVQEEYLSAAFWTTNEVLSVSGANLNDQYNNSVLKPKKSVSYNAVSSVTKKIKTIHFMDQVSVDFVVGGSHPETNGTVLQHVVIKNAAGVENKRYSFTYAQTDRLWLTGITETPTSGDPNSYSFSYLDKENLAPFASDSDPWGYNYKLPYLESTLKAGLLSSITYPIGGVREFTWEAQTFSYKGNQLLTPTEYVENPNNTTAQTFNTGFTAVSPFANANPNALTTISLDYAQRIKIEVFGINDFNHQEDQVKVILSKTNNIDQGPDIWLRNGTEYIDLDPGTYSVFIQYMPHTLDPSITAVNGFIRLNYTAQKTGDLSQFLMGGGVRIKEIVFSDASDTTIPEKRITYNYQSPENANISSGVVDHSSRGSLEHVHTRQVAHMMYDQYGNFGGSTVQYRITTKGTLSQLTRGGYVGYQHVKVAESGNGYTTYTYTTAREYPTPESVFTFPFQYAPNLDYKRGLLVTKNVFDQDNRKLQETENTQYSFVEQAVARLYKPANYEEHAHLQFFDLYADYLAGTFAVGSEPPCGLNCVQLSPGSVPGPHIMLKKDLNFVWTQLKESTTKNYFYDTLGTASVVETQTNYAYNTENYQPKTVTQTITEAGTTDTYVENRYYPVGGYPTAAFSEPELATISKLDSINRVNDPVYTQNKRNDTIVGTIQYSYNEFETNMVLPQTIKSAKGQTAVENRLVYHDYDAYGNPLEVAQERGSPIIYIWGYNYSKPIAKIANASYIGMPAAVKTKIDELVALSNTEITEAEEQTLRDRFEELRNDAYFKEAQLTSFTYDPLIGVTSQTDPKGYTMYYTYDAFNRLEFIKDAEDKLISEYKYHYKNQQ